MKVREVFPLAMLAAMFILAIVSWPTAPDRIAIHWDLSGEPDGYGGKFEGLLLLPLLSVGFYALFYFLPRLLPGEARAARLSGVFWMTRTALLATLLALYVGIHLWMRGHEVDIARLAAGTLAAGIAGIGYVLPEVEPNRLVGVRTPWTLASRAAWDRTNRLGRRLLIVSGLAALAGAVLVSGLLSLVLLVGLLFVSAVFLAAYSYRIWKRERSGSP